MGQGKAKNVWSSLVGIKEGMEISTGNIPTFSQKAREG
jgi:hypothetical protein